MTQIKSEEEVDPLTQLALQDFSYSRLNTYENCHLQYYYSYVLQEPQAWGHAAKLGNIIHKALEVSLRDKEPISLNELMENYRLAHKDYDPDAEISATMIGEGVAMLREFVDDHPGEQNVYAKELPFSFVLGPARFNGYIDFVSVHNTYARVVDYKSGRQEITYANIPTSLQLGIYALAVKRLFPDKDIQAEMYYLRKGKTRGHRFTDDDLAAVEVKLLDIVREVLTADDFKPTENERVCSNLCDYGKNGICSIGSQRLNRRNH